MKITGPGYPREGDTKALAEIEVLRQEISNLEVPTGQIDLKYMPNGPYRMQHQPGEWYMMPKTEGSTTGIGNNYQFFSPLLVTGQLTVDAVTLRQTGSSGMVDGDRILVGLYTSTDTLRPSELLYSWSYEGFYNGTNPTVFGEPITLEPGMYFVSVLNPKPDGATTINTGKGGGFIYPISDPSSVIGNVLENSTGVNGFYLDDVNVSGTMPANVSERTFVDDEAMAGIAAFRVVSHLLA